jgi:pSer/pThr/pTyr-binding forkhead associated (FHA) protein
VIGRGTDADLRINDPGVSRRHAEIRIFPGDAVSGRPQVSVHDLGSTNGMLVNGHKVAQASLDDGGTVKIGNTTMTIRYVTSGHADPGQGGPGV